jgi:hypothetical protein
MIENKVKSIKITPIRLLEQPVDHKCIEVITYRGKQLFINSSDIVDFKKGDYLFMSKMVGAGFSQINYTKMDEKEIKRYFSKEKNPLKDKLFLFNSGFLFPDRG